MEKTLASKNFIEEIIESEKDSKNLKLRFPPEPNAPGLHLGHAKAVCLNFGLAKEYGVPCNLRMDDTNPLVESKENEKAIEEDIKWLGFRYGEVKRTSDYLNLITLYAEKLIKNGKAYVDLSSSEEIASMKGTPTEPGKESIFRNDSPAKVWERWNDIKSGKERGVLRAKINMSHPNLLMRDPVIFRVIEGYGLYPMYDFAHPLSDYIEGISHSLCTLEFEVHRPLYEWVLEHVVENIDMCPRQIEFSRLNLSHAVMSKRHFNRMIEEGVVDGLDDPRLPTIAGLRNRGFTPSSIREFCNRVGITKFKGITEYALLESILRDELNASANRYMAVMDPLEVVITNLDEGLTVDVENNPEDSSAGTRSVFMSNKIWIEKEDFRVEANRKFYRLKLDGNVRLKGGVVINCTDYDTDDSGEVTRVYCKVVDSSEKVKSTIHWVDSNVGKSVVVNEYDNLFIAKEPGKETGDFMDDVNPNSLTVFSGFMEPALDRLKPGERVQFLRKGYYIKNEDGSFNKAVGLRSSFKE